MQVGQTKDSDADQNALSVKKSDKEREEPPKAAGQLLLPSVAI